MILDDSLNKEQRSAILHTDGPLRIIAGPGSGKTKVLTHKIAYLVENIGIHPKKILAVTFTNKAANVMKSRVFMLLSNKESDEVNICTLHSLALRILREECNLVNISKGFTILDSVDQKQVLRRIYQKMGLSPKTHSFSKMLEFIDKIKINLIDIDEEEKKVTTNLEKIQIKVFKEYEISKINSKSLDFNDLILYAKKIFEINKEARLKWSRKFDYLLVDEFQDTSNIEYQIVKYLAMDHKNITIVGDPDQTIYSWRGANVNIFLNFDKEFKNTTTIKMVQNYRSTKNIINCANALIKNNIHRIDKNLYTENPDGDGIIYYNGLNDNFEARWIVEQIKVLRKNKAQLKDIAILYRSNFISQKIEKMLIEESIEYKIFGGIKFFQRTEIKDTLAFLRLICNLNDDAAFERIINTPLRKIGETSQQKLFDKSLRPTLSLYEFIKENKNFINFLSKEARKEFIQFLNEAIRHNTALKEIQINVVLTKFLAKINYFDFLKNSDDEERLANVYELIGQIAEYENSQKETQLSNFSKIENYLQEITLYYSQDEITEIVDYVSLMTVHTAKGLEFTNIFIAGFSEGIFPSVHALNSIDEESMEEERRLAYVAITRAKEKLFISDSKGMSFEYDFDKNPSRFLKEMDIEHIVRMATQDISIKSSIFSNKNTTSFIIGDKIKHIKFGFGQVVAIYDDIIDVAFEEPFGVKSLLKNHNSIERND